MDNDSDVYDEESVDDSEQDSTWQTETHAASNRSNAASSSSNQIVNASSNSEHELRQQIEVLTRQSKSQQQTISQLNDRLKHLTSRNEETVAEDAKLLCQRILVKAEADSVKYRSQIQQMEEEREHMKQEASSREKMVLETVMNVRDLLSEKGDKMKLSLFNEDTESTSSQDSSAQYNILSKQLMEALATVFSHSERDEIKLRDQVKSLQEQVSNYEIMHKTAQSVNQNHQREKEAFIKKRRDLERTIHQLRDEKESVEQSLADAKEKNSSLIVMNRSLQQQIDSKECSAEHFQFNDVDSVAADDASLSFNVIQQTLEENKAQIASLLKEQELLKEKNRSLKDTILMNNEKYLNKVEELGEKYSDLEKVNSDLRKRIREAAAKNEKNRSSLKVSLEGDDELLYEV
jgi:chromosome segregation ATPase